jgi:hypothetical protein
LEATRWASMSSRGRIKKLRNSGSFPQVVVVQFPSKLQAGNKIFSKFPFESENHAVLSKIFSLWKSCALDVNA